MAVRTLPSPPCNKLTVAVFVQEFDPTVKEAAAWAIGYIAQHTAGEREKNKSRPSPRTLCARVLQ